jgi:hypothetical protein
MRRFVIAAAALVSMSFFLTAGAAYAGPVRDMYGSGAFGLPWNAGKSAIQAKYPGGQWDADDKGHDRYCVPSTQTLMKLPAPHQTKELCFLIGKDGTLAAATAVMSPTLPSLLAVVNRCRTNFGDYDAMLRDEGAIQSRFNAQLWTKDLPYVVVVRSENDSDGAPVRVTFTVADEANLYTEGSKKVDHRPTGK